MVPATGGGMGPGIFGKSGHAFSQAALAQGAHFPYNTRCGMRTDACCVHEHSINGIEKKIRSGGKRT